MIYLFLMVLWLISLVVVVRNGIKWRKTKDRTKRRNFFISLSVFIVIYFLGYAFAHSDYYKNDPEIFKSNNVNVDTKKADEDADKAEYQQQACEEILKQFFPNHKINIAFYDYAQQEAPRGIIECHGSFTMDKQDKKHEFNIRLGYRRGQTPKVVTIRVQVDGEKLFYDGDLQTQVLDEADEYDKKKSK